MVGPAIDGIWLSWAMRFTDVELDAEDADYVAKNNLDQGVHRGVWPLVGANEIEVPKLLVEFANELQVHGMAKAAALREASLTRLRPVLMTSAATIFGHFPLVPISGPGAEARNSIGIVLVSGMLVRTLFTLFVVPVFYSFIAAEHRPETDEGVYPA